VLTDEHAPWKLCYPRDLEPKGTFTFLSVPDDEGRVELTRQEDAHGMFVGFPVYETPEFSVRVPDGERFGFWPGSHNIYIVTETVTEVTDTAGNPDNGPTIYRTWFYNSDGSFAGWIAADRIGDAATDGMMLLKDDRDRLITIDKNYVVQNVEQFVWSDGSAASPHKLFPDLRIGFFDRRGELILGKWHESRR